MLLISDVHITSNQVEKILENIENFVKSNDDKNIVYMGDFVYHFNYDRKATLKIFDQMLELESKGYSIDVLAGNHDYIQDSYIFSQAQKILGTSSNIRFHTQAFETTLDGKKTLILPFNIGIAGKENKKFSDLFESENKGEHISGIINSIVQDFVDKYKDEKKLLIHHYYFADTIFPGQKAQFSYRDIALSPIWLEQENLEIISGHIHRSFRYKNYFCTGSLWATSPIEENHDKFLFSYNGGKISGFPTNQNRYIRIAKKDFEILDEKLISKTLDEQFAASEDILPNVELKKPTYDLQNVKVVVTTPSSENFEYKNFSDEELLKKIGGINVKKVLDEKNVITILNDEKANLQQNISDWQALVRKYISQKYSNADEYFELLKDLKIL